jgi:hypothetical protein
MSNNLAQLIEIAFIFFVIIFSAGCSTYPGAVSYLPHHEPGTPPQFDEVWSGTLSESGIDNRTAELGNLMLRLREDGSIDSLLMDFSGRDEGIEKSCRVDVAPDGRINVQCREDRDRVPVSFGEHPLVVLSALETMPLHTLEPFNVTTIWTGGMCCDLGYYNNSVPVFEIGNGTLVPIEKIVFHLSQGDKVYPSVICQHQAFPGWEKENNSVRPVSDRCLVAFTQEDISKAVTVKYRVDFET